MKIIHLYLTNKDGSIARSFVLDHEEMINSEDELWKLDQITGSTEMFLEEKRQSKDELIQFIKDKFSEEQLYG